jgi:hypothetical protein
VDADDQRESPALAPSLAATEEMWRSVHAEFGLLTAQELAPLLGLEDPEDVRALYADGVLIAVHRGGRVLYPGFQIDRETQRVRPVIHELLLAAENAGRSEASLILWLISPSDCLDGPRPVDLLDDPDRVLAAARDSFSHQS